jgi:hypothetical protein
MLRSHRPYLIAAAVIAVVSTAFVAYGSYFIQQRLNAEGLPGCVNPNVCGISGSELPVTLVMELLAAFVPVLLGLLLGVPLFTRKPDDTAVLPKLLTTMAAGALCTGLLALTYRYVAARYTLLANDRYELIDMFHMNNPGYMTMQTVFLIAVAGVVGLATRSFWRTLVFCAAGWPFGVGIVLCTVALVAVPLSHVYTPDLTTSTDFAPTDPRYWTSDIHLYDTIAYPATVVFVLYVLALVLLGRRRLQAARAA